MRNVYVIGVGMTPIREHWDKSLRNLLAEAIARSADDAGISLRDIESIYVGNMSSGYLQGQEHIGALVATQLGLIGVPACKIEAACASGGMAFHQAFLSVASGMYDCVVASGVEKMTDAITPDVTVALIMADDQEYVANYGATFVSLNALVYRYYMEKYNVKQEDIALFPVHCHRYAQNNPYAQYRRAVSLEDVLKSPLIADPIRLLESAPIGDGAASIVLCSENFIREKGLSPEVLVQVAASAAATDTLSIHEREDISTLTASIKASRKAYEMAKVEPNDIDVLEVHDAFSILGILHLEDLGFAEKGKGTVLVKEGELEVGGKIPTNLFGGLKARGHPVGATGIYQIAEVFLQLTGRAGKSQVDGATVGMAQNVGGVGSTVVVNILKRVR